MLNFKNKKNAFTLPEVLTTLAVIGIIAMYATSVIVQGTQDKINKNKQQMALSKLTKALEIGLLNTSSAYTYVGSSASSSNTFFNLFLNKNIQMTRYCGTSTGLSGSYNAGGPTTNLSQYMSCYTAQKFKTADNKEVKISSISNGTFFNSLSDSTHAYTSYPVSFTTKEGVDWLLVFNTNCPMISNTRRVREIYPWIYSDGKPLTSAVTSCISGIYDVNGEKGPNKIGKDVFLLNVTKLGSTCAVSIGGKCYSSAIVPSPLTYAQCEAQKDSLGIKGCFNFDNKDDYWAGAAAACGGVNKMISRNDLIELINALYNTSSASTSSKAIGVSYYNLQYNTGTATAYGLPEPGFKVWMGEESLDKYGTGEESYDNIGAFYYNFGTNQVTMHELKRYATGSASAMYTLCRQ